MKQPRTTLQYLLMALVPYSRQNLKLAFTPYEFFKELEKVSHARHHSFEVAMSRAKKRGLVEQTKFGPRLTTKGLASIKPFLGEKLKNSARLMVIFDIPESESVKRRLLRQYLRKFEFEQAQRSVWLTNYDFREEVQQVVHELGVDGYVQLYECARMNIV